MIEVVLGYHYENQPEIDAHIKRHIEDAVKRALGLSDPDFRGKLIDLKCSN